MTAPSPREAARVAREATYRSHILAAAERLVGRRGLERTRMEDVTREAQVALATIYRLFPTKQDLYRSLADTRARAVFDHAHATSNLDANPLDNLLAFVMGIVDYLLDNPETLRFTLRTMPTSWGLDDDDADWATRARLSC